MLWTHNRRNCQSTHILDPYMVSELNPLNLQRLMLPELTTRTMNVLKSLSKAESLRQKQSPTDPLLCWAETTSLLIIRTPARREVPKP